MQNPLIDFSCLAGLFVIFLLAAVFQANFFWLAGVISQLLILAISNKKIEMTRRMIFLLAVLSWLFTILTITQIITFRY
jgi:hypothetical protein